MRPPRAVEKVISGRLEDPHVEVEIGADQIAGAVLELVHAPIGVGDPVDRRARARLGRERRRLRLHHLAQHEQFGDEILRRRRLQVPGEHLRIEHVPVGLRPHPRADLRPRDDHRLGGEHAIGFPQRGAGDRKARAHLGRVGQERSGGIDPADDLAPEPPGERRMDVALEPRAARSRRSARSAAERGEPGRARWAAAVKCLATRAMGPRPHSQADASQPERRERGIAASR